MPNNGFSGNYTKPFGTYFILKPVRQTQNLIAEFVKQRSGDMQLQERYKSAYLISKTKGMPRTCSFGCTSLLFSWKQGRKMN